jgi:hypothetical protein
MDHVKLTESKLDVQQITELVAHESCGAVSLFVGTTRDNFEGKTVSFLNRFLKIIAYTKDFLTSRSPSLSTSLMIRWPKRRCSEYAVRSVNDGLT